MRLAKAPRRGSGQAPRPGSGQAPRRGVALLALIVLWLTISCALAAQPRQPLEEVYTPSFSRVPPREPASLTLQTLAADWRGQPGTSFRRDLRSAQALIVAAALCVLCWVGIDRRRLRNPRNIDLALLFLPGVLLFDSMRFFDVLRSATYLNLLDWVFSAVVFVSLALLVRASWRCVRPLPSTWTPNPRTSMLVALAIVTLGLNLTFAFVRPPDDAGWFVNLGAQRLRERGQLPYGDPLLTATPAAAYGPLLYVAHVPFQVVLAPNPVNDDSPDLPALGPGSSYYVPPALATQLCTAAFHLLGVAALFICGRRMASVRVALGLVCLYCGSLAVLGVGGPNDSVAGITFASHIAPASTTLVAFALWRQPLLSGAMLAISTGVGFYPAFLAPAFLGHYWDEPSRRLKFILGFGLVAVLIVGFVYSCSRPAGNRSRIGTIMYDTLGHHTDPAGYGSSPFGFWGQRGGFRDRLTTPLVRGSTLTSPAWLAFAGLIGITFFLARSRPAADLALLSGAVALGATLVKPHATGTYLAWYYPLLLIGFLAGGFTSRPQKV
jgi:hypothetical protein